MNRQMADFLRSVSGWALVAAIASWSVVAHAREGMFTPDQLPAIAADLREAGLKLHPDKLNDLTAFPMAAVVSLGGCTASFVSPQGLVVTNHHCARGSVQFHSKPERNYLEEGFLAASMADELPAPPGARVYVALDAEDVTARIAGDLDPALAPRDRYQAMEDRRKAVMKECESDPGHRCRVSSFFGGLQYKRIKYLEIRDVRLVYAPADAVGRYGGDVDNWRWPRHTGDFAFYRAYVSPAGEPADHSPDNVPYEPEHHLAVSAAGLDDGDFVMALGYPGGTSRYARHVTVENLFEREYPRSVARSRERIAVIEAAAPEGSDLRIRYTGQLAGINNGMKNREGQLEGARRQRLVERRAQRDAALDAWIGDNAGKGQLADAIRGYDALARENAAASRRYYHYNAARGSQLFGIARRLYRLAREQEKPDAEREPGYQERDLRFFRQGLSRLDRRYHATVDKALWMYALRGYLAEPDENRVGAFDEALGLADDTDEATLSSILDAYYANTVLEDAETRLSLMDATATALEEHDDPFLRLATAVYDSDMAREEAGKTRSGRGHLLRPQYMQAIIDWQRSQGQTTYPDANGTLRITYGTVLGGSPMDGLIYEPFTRLEGILEKDSGIAPFNAPVGLLERARAKDHGAYRLESIGSVPVNFLTDLDSTGGNSGSPTLNANGELVGLLFDGTLESVVSDWDFNPRNTRTIHVDTRYMLWVMEKIDNADWLIDEMTVVQ
ncbi:MAG: S46 family peptidase [Gammaproteobacteria bacterium]|nr:S46 family peptidase [Gammaproteobacteria bacterium]